MHELSLALLPPGRGAVCASFATSCGKARNPQRPITAMPATPDDLFAMFDRLGIAHTTVSHQPLFTVEQSQALRGQIPGGHTKNLFLRDKKAALYLVTAPEDGAIALK